MEKSVKTAKKILKDVCERHKHHDKDIMQGVEGERRHGLDVLHWVEKRNNRSPVPLKIAALFHDIDRVVTPKFGGGFKGKRNTKAYKLHKTMHAKRSADYTIPVLRKNGFSEDILKRVEFLILHHDDTGSKVEKMKDQELDCLVAADSFAFFTTIAPKLYKAEGIKRIKDKIAFMVEKMPSATRRLLKKHRLQNKIFEKLKNEAIRDFHV